MEDLTSINPLRKQKIVWSETEKKVFFDEIVRIYKEEDGFEKNHAEVLADALLVFPTHRRRTVGSVIPTTIFTKRYIQNYLNGNQETDEYLKILSAPLESKSQDIQSIIEQEVSNRIPDNLGSVIDVHIKSAINSVFDKLDISNRINKIIVDFKERVNKEVTAFSQLMEEQLPKKNMEVHIPKVTSSSCGKRKIAVYGITNQQKQQILKRFKDTDLDISFYFNDDCGSSSAIVSGCYLKIFVYSRFMSHAKLHQIRNIYNARDIVQINGGMWSIYNKIEKTMGLTL